MTYKSRANCSVIPVTMILALRSCVMVLCASWYFLMCRPGIIPCAVTCTPRYFALVVVCIRPVANGGHLKSLLLVELSNMCLFAASIDVSILFSFAHLEQISNAKTSSHKESASTMTSSAYRRTGVLSMLPTEAHSCLASVSMYMLNRVGHAGPPCVTPRLIFAVVPFFVTYCVYLEFLDDVRYHIC